MKRRKNTKNRGRIKKEKRRRKKKMRMKKKMRRKKKKMTHAVTLANVTVYTTKSPQMLGAERVKNSSGTSEINFGH